MALPGGLSGYTSSFPYQSSTVPGAGVYGGQVAQLGIPPNTFTQSSQAIPGFSGNAQQANSFINSELLGQLSPASRSILQDKSASWGVSSGAPGSGLAQDNWDTSRLLSSIGYQQHGLNDLGNYANWLGGMQTNPALAAQIAEQNAISAASPNPTMVAQELQNQQNKGKWGKIIGSTIGTIGGYVVGGPTGAQIGGQLGGNIGYTAGGGMANPGAGIGSTSYQSALGGIGSGMGGYNGYQGLLGGQGQNALSGGYGTGSGYGLNPNTASWYQNPASDPYNAGPSGGTGQYSNPFSGIGSMNDASPASISAVAGFV